VQNVTSYKYDAYEAQPNDFIFRVLSKWSEALSVDNIPKLKMKLQNKFGKYEKQTGLVDKI
jgi:hypothetical protein